MKIKKPDKRRMGRMSRAVMLLTGRKGKRSRDTQYFLENKQRILTAWSRTNLEGRIKSWTGQHVLSSVVIAGVQAGVMEFSCPETTDDALWRAMLWRR